VASQQTDCCSGGICWAVGSLYIQNSIGQMSEGKKSLDIQEFCGFGEDILLARKPCG
jgi:hypothetical protein